MKKNMPDPAFPVILPAGEDGLRQFHIGMTLRDYFAAQVISKIIDYAPSKAEAAESAYRVADAMLEARAK